MKLASCPPIDQLREFSSGRLADEALETLAEHVDDCPTCRQVLAEASRGADPLLAALREPLTAAPFSEETEYRRAMEVVEALGRSPDTAAGSPTLAARGRAGGPEGAAVDSPPLQTIREYQLQRKLGEGGMGAVYQALHTRLDKLVAIKVLPADRMRDAGAVARFQREMKAVGRVDHPNIVRAMDAGEENGLHYLVMEYVPGIDLAYLSRARGPLPIADACELVRQAALGLAEAHEHGMVHRDIKPSNLILAQPRKKKDQPTVKILDLGLALLSEALSPDQQGLTSTGQMMGTIDYMAPEQGGDSHQVDIRADLYSLGATLYKLLTGEAPFSGEKYDTPVKKLMALATQAPPPVRSRRADVPGALASLVENLLAKDPEERLATPEDVAEALEPFCRGADLGKLLRETAPPPATVEPLPRQANLGTQPSYSDPTGNLAPTIDHAAPLAGGGQPDFSFSPRETGAGATTHSRRAPTAQGGRKIPRWALVAAACSSAALLLLGTIFYIQTGDGTVQIEINDPAIQVVLNNDGKALIKGADKKHEIRVSPGSHGLTITRGDFSFETPKFELKRKEVVVLKVEYLPGKVRVATAGGEVLSEKPLPSYALQFDGVDDYVELPTLKFDPAEAFTMEIWAEVENLQASPQLLHYSGVPGRRAKIQVGIPLGPDRPNLQAAVTSGPPQQPKENPEYAALRFDETFPVGTHHIALCWSPDGSAALYWNGRRCPAPIFLDRNKSWPSGTSSMIGANPKADGTRSQFLKGSVRQVRFSRGVRYSNDFSPAESWQPEANTLALYRFDEGAGDTLYDTSGNGHHGKIVGAKWIQNPTSNPVRANFALQFDGSDDYVATTAVCPTEGPVTIEAWIRASSDATAGHEIINANDPGGGLGFMLLSPAHAGLKQQAEPVWAAVPATNPIPREEWVHMAAVFDGKALEFFVNGVSQGQRHVDKPLRPTTPFAIGRDSKASLHHFAGLIDEVRISTIARYTDSFTPQRRFESDPDTLALYHFDDGNGETLVDSSGNGHHGKVLGAQWVRVDQVLPSDSSKSPRHALEFDGLDDYVTLPKLEWDRKSPRTFEAWVTPRTDQSRLSAAQAVWGHQGCFLLAETFGWQFYHHKVSAIGGHVKAGRRVHLVAQWDGTRCVLYVNGVGARSEAGVIDPAKGVGITIMPRVLGAMGNNQGEPLREHFAGRIDEVRVSNSARYPNDGFTPPERFEVDADTLLLYHIDEGQGDVLTDSSGNGHHGKIVGAKWIKLDSRAEAASLSFDGVDDYVVFEGAMPQDAVTVEAWITLRVAAEERMARTVFNFADSEVHYSLVAMNGECQWVAGQRTPQLVRAAYDSQPMKDLAAENDKLRKVHVAAQWQSGAPRLWIDGTEVAHQNERLAKGLTRAYEPRLVFGTAFQEMAGSDKRHFDPFAGELHELRVSRQARYAGNFVPPHSFETDDTTWGLYRLTEGEGSVLTDSSGNNHHGKIVGAKWGQANDASSSSQEAAGSIGYALSLPADVQLTQPDVEVDLAGPFTLEAYVTSRDGEKSQFLGIERFLGLNQQRTWFAMVLPSPNPYAILRSTSDVVAGKRTHVAAVFTGTHLRWFVDGSLQETQDITAAVPKEKRRLKFSAYTGLMDEIRLSKVARYEHAFQPEARFRPDPDTLVLYHCDEGTGDLLTDSSGNGHHLKIVGAKWVLGIPPAEPSVESSPFPPYVSPSKHALLFDGKTNYVEFPSLRVDNARPLTIEMDIQPSKEQVVDLLTNGSLGFIWDAKRSPPHFKFGGQTAAGDYPLVDALLGKIPDGVLHLAGVVDGSELRIYVNGRLAQRKSLGGSTIAPPKTIFTLGANEWLAKNKPGSSSDTDSYLNFFEGSVHRLRISQVARYQEDFRPGAPFEPDQDTVALYQFDEGQGDVLTDSSGNGHHGKIVGAKWVQTDGQSQRKPPPMSLAFDGQDDYVVIPSLRRDDFNPFTLELWAEDQPRGAPLEALARVEGRAVAQIMLRERNRCEAISYHSTTADGKTFAWLSNIADRRQSGGRHHYALVFDKHPNGYEVRQFIDGRLVGTDCGPAPFPHEYQSQASLLGAGWNDELKPWCFYKGCIDELRVSRVARYTADFTPESTFEGDRDTLALYHFDEGQGDVLTDSSGNNHHGKIVGATWAAAQTPPKPVGGEYALQFAGASDIVKIPSLVYDNSYSVTVEAWLTPKKDQPHGFALTWGDPSGQHLQLKRGGWARWEFLVADAKNNRWIESSSDESAIQVGRRDHVAGTWDGRKARIYVNGRFAGESTNPEQAGFSPHGPLQIGNVEGATQDAYFAGTIDQVRISKGVRYESNFSPPDLNSLDDNVLALYLFRENGGDALLDSSGNNHHGKIVGAKWVRTEAAQPPPAATGWQGWPADAPPPAIAPFDAAQAKAHQTAWAQYLKLPVEWENPIGMKFRLIPPGEFFMGSTPEELAIALARTSDMRWQEHLQSETPRHKVILTQPLYLAIHEVTQGQYQRVMGTNPSHFAAAGAGKELVGGVDTSQHPVESVTVKEMAEFCTKLSEAAGPAATGDAPLKAAGYRLPTEAEWEFACRAGTTTRFWSGDLDEDLSDTGWTKANASNHTHAVGNLRANPFGLYDLHGNIGERVQDFWEPAYYGQFAHEAAVNPAGPSGKMGLRVFRGGVFNLAANGCCSSFRLSNDPSLRYYYVGFRVALPIVRGKSVSEPQAAAASLPIPTPPPPAIVPFDAAQAKAHQTAWAQHLKLPVEETNSIEMKLRLIPPGEFPMGSTKGDANETPVHSVTISKPFYLGQHEVTQHEYESVMGEHPSKFQGKRLPVEFVTVEEAVEYCRRLSEKEGKTYRLPTEAEWEFACRAGTTTEWSYGDDPAAGDEYSWCKENGDEKTHPVGEKLPNPFGLFDMHGNVFEYCADFTGAYTADAAVDPVGPGIGRYRGFRGGSWFFPRFDSRSADRQDKIWPPRGSHVGFRVVRVIESDAAAPVAKDREIAEWVMSIGGWVNVKTAEKDFVVVLPGHPLPSEPYILRKVYFLKCAISDADVARIANMPQMYEVSLQETPVTPACLKHLRNLPELRHLNLSQTKIAGEDLRHLSTLPRLQYLNLWGTPVGDSDIEHLVGLKLKEVILGKTSVTAEGINRLQNAQPECNVRMD